MARPRPAAPRLLLGFLLFLAWLSSAPAHPASAATDECSAEPTALCLQGRFEARVSWRDPSTGTDGVARATALTAESGHFWFFDAANVEVVLKVLDGRAINGRFWVYFASLSDVEYTLAVRDLETGVERSYRNPAGKLASHGDVEAFPPGSGPGFAAPPPLPEATAPSSATCAASAERACLQTARFAVSLLWRDPATGTSGVGRAAPLTGDTATFWFFHPANVEVVAKVLDGRAINGNFWVYFASLSNVEYTLEVLDTFTGQRQTWINPAGRFTSVADTAPAALRPPPADFGEAYRRVRDEATRLSPAGFAERYAPAARAATLGYDPLQAERLDGALAALDLSNDQMAGLAANGFVVLDELTGDTFETVYSWIYERDLPLLVTTDSVLYALHRSYDSLLEQLELQVLRGELDALLAAMHAELEARFTAGSFAAADSDSAHDADVYLAVARSLLQGSLVMPASSQTEASRVSAILADAAALQPAPLALFGPAAPYDYSQLRPRGHYEDNPLLQTYFRAMMWLGRTELPLVRFEDGEAILGRRAVAGAVLLDDLLEQSGARQRWERIDLVIRRMVGDPDSMTPADMRRFRAELGIAGLGDLGGLSDADLLAKLLGGDYGVQRIMSQILYNDTLGAEQIQLPRVFLLMGQRFVIDSYVFHHLTFDRLGPISRMLPSPLDVPFSLGSGTAAELLQPELERYPIQGKLHEVRFLVESHPADFWRANLYNGWLAALRALEGADPPSDRDRRPSTLRTRAWDRKMLNTQLASWAELRHDTLLYAKQSYSGGVTCEYPDAYVEPYPAFFEAMADLGSRGYEMALELGGAGFQVAPVLEWFGGFVDAMDQLAAIARKELAHEELTTAERDFLRQTIEIEMVGCGPVHWDGWYGSLFFDQSDMGALKPTIADVHTAPTDEEGNEVGWVLHVATGPAQLALLTVPHGDGARTFVGPVSTYFERLEEQFRRRTDSEWLDILFDELPQRPAWTREYAQP